MCLSRDCFETGEEISGGGGGLCIMDRKAQSLDCFVLLDRLSIESYHGLGPFSYRPRQ
jgi:hypothetical protein